jgi:predicted transcriptional regulator
MERRAIEIARKKIFYCNKNDTIKETAFRMQEKNIGSILVRDDPGAVIGIVTVGDILRLIAKHDSLKEFHVKDIMSTPVISGNKDITIEDAMKMFQEKKISRLVLIDETGKPVGILRDVAVYKILSFSKFEKEAADRFSSHWEDHFY